MEKTLRLSAEQREDLVAYLDGELPDAKAQLIDTVLARSEVARHEVEVLARTWEMLDVLPTPKAPPEFTERTMTTLKVAEVPYDITEQAWFHWLKRGAMVAVWVAALSLSGWLGFQITHAWVENPTDQLLSDLPTLKKLNLYQDIESIDFLDKLQKNHLFDDAPEVAMESKSINGMTMAQRHAYIASMNQIERDRLQRNIDAFKQMSPADRDRYRALNEELDGKPEGRSLSILALTYSAWLETLTPGQREELRQRTESSKKLPLVQQYKDQQYKDPWDPAVTASTAVGEPVQPPRFFRQPTMPITEVQAVLKMIVAELPEEEQIKAGKNMKPEQVIEVLRRSIHQAPGGPRTWPSTEVQDKVVNTMPQGLRLMVRKTQSERERSAQFLFFSILQGFEEFRPRAPDASKLEQTLGELDEGQRARLDKMPIEEKRKVLEKRYLEQHERPRMELQRELVGLMNEIGVMPPPPPPRHNEFGPNRPDDRPGPPPDRRDPPPRDGTRPLERSRENGRPGERPRREPNDSEKPSPN